MRRLVVLEEEELRALVRDEVRRGVREELQGTASVQVAGGELLTAREAASLARVTPATIRSWVSAGTLRRHGNGRMLRIGRSELLQLLEGGGHAGQERSPEQEADELLRRRMARAPRAGRGR